MFNPHLDRVWPADPDNGQVWPALWSWLGRPPQSWPDLAIIWISWSNSVQVGVERTLERKKVVVIFSAKCEGKDGDSRKKGVVVFCGYRDGKGKGSGGEGMKVETHKKEYLLDEANLFERGASNPEFPNGKSRNGFK
ncbi:hypothetical protein K438DRAFT_1752586 [Mycena galopus ATCC 62051]|nr:hypothetical protein K438DRAFT_1752586 [Mycena galopus ATCC 62051]